MGIKRKRRPEVETDLVTDTIAQEIVSPMTPLEKGLLIYPNAVPIQLKSVPFEVLKDHLRRYTKSELEDGQFFEVLLGKYTFFMDEKAYRLRRGIAD